MIFEETKKNFEKKLLLKLRIHGSDWGWVKWSPIQTYNIVNNIKIHIQSVWIFILYDQINIWGTG
jgi:hypothetical protein